MRAQILRLILIPAIRIPAIPIPAIPIHRLALLWATAMLLTAPRPTQAEAPPVKTRAVYALDLTEPARFEAMSKQVGNERFVKFVVDLTRNRLIFFDVNVYEMHADFVFAEILQTEATPAALYEFNLNYRVDKPLFLLGLVVHHVQQDQWTLQFAASDQLRPNHITTALTLLDAHLRIGPKQTALPVRFMPDSVDHERVLKDLGPDVPTITRDKLYKAATYHAFTTGRAVGRLRIVRDVSRPEALDFDAHDIVVLPGDLPDITVVAGIISERFSTPLSHVALRARSRGIPHVGLKGAGKRYASFDGKVVVFDATAASHTLRLATPEEVAGLKRGPRHGKPPVTPPLDLGPKTLAPLPTLGVGDAGAYGAKTANLGAVAAQSLGLAKVPEGFGIPVFWYHDHLRRHGLDARVKALLADPKVRSDRAHRRAALEALRRAITDAPLDPVLLKQVLRASDALGGPTRLFVRSSTNAEDLPGFSGAGLYDTVPNVTGEEALSAAIRRVWASVWNLRAFEERAWFGIDHATVRGAVLIQRGINATAAGVLITTNVRDPSQDWLYTINAKKGLGIRVVEGKRIPEQILFNVVLFSMTVVSRSDETTQLVFDARGGVREVPVDNPGEAVLTEARANALAQTAKEIAGRLPWKKPIDIEWLYEGDQLYIVQARPWVF